MQKKALTAADYSKWGELTLKKMNHDGQWISYTMRYQNEADTLFVKNTRTFQTYNIPLGNNGDFAGQEWFISKIPSGVHLINLKNAKQETVSAAIKYSYSPKTKLLLILKHSKSKDNELLIRTLDGNIRERISGVVDFVTDPTGQIVLYTIKTGVQSTVELIGLSKNNSKTVIVSSLGSFNNLTCDKAGKNAVAFIQNADDSSGQQNTLFYYNLQNRRLYTSKTDTQTGFLGDSLYITDTSYKLQISDDSQKVFFIVRKKGELNHNIKGSDVQLWNGNDKWIYPIEQKQKPFTEIYLAQWHPAQDKYLQISNDALPRFMLNGDQKYAILSSPKQYEPQYTKDGLTDYYITDLSTGKSELFLKKQSAHFLFTIPSPAGKYVAYFYMQNWWVYDIKKNTHTNITKGIGHSFFHNKKEYPKTDDPYPHLGWTTDDREILLVDNYDIWAFSPNGSSPRRLTQGRETKTQFRLAGSSNTIRGKANYNGWMLNPIDLENGLALESDNGAQLYGYYNWSSKANKNMIFSDSSRMDQFVRSENGRVFMYREQRYDLSPRLMVKNGENKIPEMLLQSNPQQQFYDWGRAELIEYKNAKGKSLKGILYYPAGYSKEKKYPMIVYIYEKLSGGLHNYINPSQFTGDGLFNISTFTTQGYFVLSPDISYETGDPGISAVDCVVSAVNQVISKGIVKADKIGLIGHSFGGYETNFIITQTSLFAAAVAGSAVSDLTSFYLSSGTASGRPEFWRMENQQWRMGKSLFEDRAGYRRNSPVEHVSKVTTPLFSWTGDSDQEANWHQSIEFYLALHRLNKQQIMAVYPNEGHALLESQNQKDLSVRLHQWFDYYLKDEIPAAWIKAGIK